MVECLHSKYKALNSNPSTIKAIQLQILKMNTEIFLLYIVGTVFPYHLYDFNI
jgi:hypothetical protein